MTDTLTTDSLFEYMCRFDVCVMNVIQLISVPALARVFNETKYRVRKCMNELREKGLVDSGYESFYSDWHCQWFIVRGFYVTKKGKGTDTHRQASEREMKLIEECFGGNAEEDTNV